MVPHAFLAAAVAWALFFWARTMRRSIRHNWLTEACHIIFAQPRLRRKTKEIRLPLIGREDPLAGILNSLRKLFVFLVSIAVLAVSTLVIFELFVAEPVNLPVIIKQLGYLAIFFGFWLTAIYYLRRVKNLLTPRLGLQVATIAQFLLLAIALLVMVFTVLDIFGVPISTLLTSAGIITVTVGLIISTFVGGLLSGALVFTTHQLKVGEDVMVNNMPGKIVDMTALVIRIRTDVGQITIPNSAIASGGVIVTTMLKPEVTQETRLHYNVGDRVITSYRNEEGTVKELTAFHTTVALDSGAEITFLNTSVLTGTVAVAKIGKVHHQLN
jgi:small-conductance mechanosensitive channel